jgi:succinyl-CoA synthetase alpha subunit
MGTPANLEILAQAGLAGPGTRDARPGDLVIVIEAESEDALAPAQAEANEALEGRPAAAHSGGPRERPPRSLALASQRLAEADLAQVSVPGPYAAAEAVKAVRRGLHVFLFSDNVPVGQERELKRLAAKHGVLVMGPDCGTAIVRGVPLGFANAVRRGAIGLVGASGTGLQEVTCRIDAHGGGVSHALGTGGRDVSADIGGASMRHAVDLLAADEATKVIVIVSKPPDPAVARAVLSRLEASGKPGVVLFLGQRFAPGTLPAGLHAVATLEEAATAAVALSQGDAPPAQTGADDRLAQARSECGHLAPGQRYVRALYSGGTFCTEALLLWRAAGIEAWSNAPVDPARSLADARASREHTAVDLGDDEFTVGRPHPMIDPAPRIERLAQEAGDPSVAAIVLDVVIGHGAHADPAGALAEPIRDAKAAATSQGRHLAVIAFVTGTERDAQRLSAQQATLREAGAIVTEGATAAAELAGQLALQASRSRASQAPASG